MYSIASKIRGVLQERQQKANYFSLLCHKLGEAELLLGYLVEIAEYPSTVLDVMRKAKEKNIAIRDLIDVNVLGNFLRDVLKLATLSRTLKDSKSCEQIRNAYDIDSMLQQCSFIENKRMEVCSIAQMICKSPEPQSSASNSTCPPSSSSASHESSPVNFSENSPPPKTSKPVCKSDMTTPTKVKNQNAESIKRLKELVVKIENTQNRPNLSSMREMRDVLNNLNVVTHRMAAAKIC